MAKPLVIFVDGSEVFLSDRNSNRDGLVYFLKQHHCCDVALYKDYIRLEEGFQKLTDYFSQLILVIVKQDYNQHDMVIGLIRNNKEIRDVPIVVIPCFGEGRFKGVPSDKLIHAFDYTDKRISELISDLVNKWKLKQDEQALLMSQLSSSYDHNYPDDEGMFSTPSDDQKIIAQSLRIKLLPSEFVKKEFDEALIMSKKAEFVSVAEDLYLKELGKLRIMDEKQREKFWDKLMEEQGYVRTAGGGFIYSKSVGLGEKIYGFAIDPDTLETKLTNNFGEHRNLRLFLAERLHVIEALKGNKVYLTHDEEQRCFRRIIEGLIFANIKGFSLPILRLVTIDHQDNMDMDPVKKVAKFLYNQRKFIVIDSENKLIEN